MDGSKKRMVGMVVGLAMFLIAATAAALSCVGANAERVTYEMAEIRIDGEVVEAPEFGDEAVAAANYNEGVVFDLKNEQTLSQLDFTGGAQ